MKVPKVILEAQEFRKKVVAELNEEYAEEEGEEGIPQQEMPTDLDLTREFANVKERTNYALLQLYETKGYDVFKQVCLNMKGNNWFNTADYGFFKGECAEVYLYVTILEFIKKYELPWKAHLSLVIPHRSGKEGATTEIDLVLVSEQMITVFESKSYGGDKKITDVCSITASGRTRDIYGQNALHCESLIKQIAGYNINDQKGMKSVLFSYAKGELEDDREIKYKRLMPVVTEDNVLAYLTSLTKLEAKYWKQDIYERVNELSNKLTMEDHLKHINRGKSK